MNRRKITVFRLCLTAMAVGINVAGGQLALVLRLPIYLDSIGTILIGALFGPWMGMLPNFLSGILMGMTTDIYSLYFAPAGMVTGFMNGLVWQRWVWKRPGMPGTVERKRRLWLCALAVAIPGTMVSSLICAAVFGGVTSSGSMVLVQLLARTPLGMTASIFLVQILTDYLDRALSMFMVAGLVQALPGDMRNVLQCSAAPGNSRREGRNQNGGAC